MQLTMLKSKIHQAAVTGVFRDYPGSLTVDSELMEEAGLLPHEKILVANLENTTTAYYVGWPQRRAEVLKKGLRGRAMGYGTSYYYSFIREPLTLDFSKPAP